MAQYNQNIEFSAGNDIVLAFDAITKDDNPGQFLSESDILGVSWAMSPFEDDSTVIIQKMLGSGITKTLGNVRVTLAAADTTDLSGEYTHELRIKTALGIQTASRGKVTIKYRVGANPV